MSDLSMEESYGLFIASMMQECHCEPPHPRPCDGVLAGGLCDGLGHDHDDLDGDAEDPWDDE